MIAHKGHSKMQSASMMRSNEAEAWMTPDLRLPSGHAAQRESAAASCLRGMPWLMPVGPLSRRRFDGRPERRRAQSTRPGWTGPAIGTGGNRDGASWRHTEVTDFVRSPFADMS